MYVRRMRGPASVLLPDGRRMTRADLPAPDTCRWVARRKAAVACAVVHGLISAQEACTCYRLTEEELAGWCRRFSDFGERGLKATQVQRYRQP